MTNRQRQVVVALLLVAVVSFLLSIVLAPVLVLVVAVILMCVFLGFAAYSAIAKAVE